MSSTPRSRLGRPDRVRRRDRRARSPPALPKVRPADAYCPIGAARVAIDRKRSRAGCGARSIGSYLYAAAVTFETVVRGRFGVRRGANLGLRFFLGLPPRCWLVPLGASLLGRRPDHRFELHAVRIGKIDGVVFSSVIFTGRIDDIHAILFEKCAKRIDVFAACHFESVVMKADIALAIFVFPTFGIGGGNPEQRLTVAPSGHIVVFVLELEAEKGQELGIESF